MVRRKSYFSKSNRGNAGGVFLNNIFADMERSKKERDKEAARQNREAERERKKSEKEAEKNKQRLAREAEKKQQKKQMENKKIREKTDLYANRVNLELTNLGVFPGPETCQQIAFKAIEAGVSLNQIEKYFLTGKKLDTVAVRCGKELMEKNGVGADYFKMTRFPELLEIVGNFRPQGDVIKSSLFKQKKLDLDDEVRSLAKKKVKHDVKMSLIDDLVESKAMFSHELRAFADILAKTDWS